MYDFVPEEPKQSAKLKNLDLHAVPDLSDLSTPELSFDLHNYIDFPSQVPAETLLVNILAEKSEISGRTAPVTTIPSVNFDYPMGHSAGFGSEAGIKQESTAGVETPNAFTVRSISGYALAGSSQLPNAALKSDVFRGDQREVSFKSEEKKSTKKIVDKESDEYRRRRERNNAAVQKSRKKAKQLFHFTEKRVSDLVSENELLRKRVDLLTKELSVLKNLLSNVVVSPETAAQNME